MPGNWVDHAADPIEPTLFAGEDGHEESITPFLGDDEGKIIEVLLHNKGTDRNCNYATFKVTKTKHNFQRLRPPAP